MSTLIVGNGYQTPLPRLGRNRGLHNWSQKSVSKAVRKNLREQYGLLNVEVGCTPELGSDGWHGSCELYQEKFGYKITA